MHSLRLFLTNKQLFVALKAISNARVDADKNDEQHELSDDKSSSETKERKQDTEADSDNIRYLTTRKQKRTCGQHFLDVLRVGFIEK